jgi:bifunctional non-homologous end joining protein LigD
MVICGYMPSDKASRAFSSLLCCVNEEEELIYTGSVGTGFNEELQKDILGKLDKIKIKKVPVANPPDKKNIVWVKPELTCEVKFSSWTKDKIMRHPSFVGLRSDKKPDEITIEKPVSPSKAGIKAQFSNLEKMYFGPKRALQREM